MRNIYKCLNNTPYYNRLFNGLKLLTTTGIAQIIIQALSLISGILIIRLLPLKEYALYTITNTALGSLTLLADGGISTAIMAHGGKVWTDRQKLGAVMATGLDLRKKFGLLSLAIAIPIIFLLLIHQHASILFACLIVLSLVPAFYAALSDSILEIAPKLTQDISLLQKNQVLTSIGRLILITASVFIFPWTFIAMLGNGLPRIWANVRLKNATIKYVDFEQAPDPVIKKEVLKIVKLSLPGIIYYCLSGQITIWLISIFGNTSSIAQVGAVGRITILLTIAGTLFGTLIIPRFARLPNKPQLLIKRYLLLVMGSVLISLVIVFATWIFSNQLLWVLGKNYKSLNNILVLSMASGCFSMIVGVTFGLYTSRGFVFNPLISIPLNILIVICGLLFFNISNVYGVFLFNLFVAAFQAMLHFFYGIIRLIKIPVA